jgi:putative DNA primase/helicase
MNNQDQPKTNLNPFNLSSGRILQTTFQDSPLAEHLATKLADRLCWTSARGWLEYHSGVWVESSEAFAIEQVRDKLKEAYLIFVAAASTTEEIKTLAPLLTKTKAANVTYFLRGILLKEAAEFDTHPDLLNVKNGVIDLRVGELHKHHHGYLFTKQAPVPYIPERFDPDWEQALEAIPEDVRDWLQVRFGQACTGYMTPDDKMPVLQGGGSNGKSTIVAAIQSTLGSYATVVPDRVLLSNPGDHPTELTTLQGARFALIEETPEARHLNIKRLKDVVGTPTMTARRMRQDNETWQATHSLFLTTNYRPGVKETDRGSWRRLALVHFPYTFKDPADPLLTPTDRHGDPGLRDRLIAGRGSQWEAVLVWLVEGARAWYEMGKEMLPEPESVKRDTLDWRTASDHILGFTLEALEFDPTSCVLSSELYTAFNAWLAERGHAPCSDETFSGRFGGHENIEAHNVTKVRSMVGLTLSRPFYGSVQPVTKQPRVWVGVRFRTS